MSYPLQANTEPEQEYLSLFPALAVSYYSNKKGLKAELDSDRLLGVPLETYIPSEKLAMNDRACISTTLSLLKFVIPLSASIYSAHNPIH